MDELDWKKLDVESLQLALSQGELYLKETIDTANYQTNKALTVLQVSIGLFIGVLGYIIGVLPDGIILWESLLLLKSL